MLSIMDIARYFVGNLGEVESEKLLYLCFYAQGKTLLKTDEPLFEEDFIVRNGKLYLFSGDERFFSFKDRISERHFNRTSAPISKNIAEELDEILRWARSKDLTKISELLPKGPEVLNKSKVKYIIYRFQKNFR